MCACVLSNCDTVRPVCVFIYMQVNFGEDWSAHPCDCIHANTHAHTCVCVRRDDSSVSVPMCSFVLLVYGIFVHGGVICTIC